MGGLSVRRAALARGCFATHLMGSTESPLVHHAKGIEVYKGKLILYGCGDSLNDYEGMPGYEQHRFGTRLAPTTKGGLALRWGGTR